MGRVSQSSEAAVGNSNQDDFMWVMINPSPARMGNKQWNLGSG